MATRRQFIHSVSAAGVLLATSVRPAQAAVPAMTKKTQAATTPDKALQMLKEGNERFASGRMHQRDLMAQVKATASGQTKKVSGTFYQQLPPPANAKVNSIGDCLKARVRLQIDLAARFVLVTYQPLASFSRNVPKDTASFASGSWPRQPQPRGRTDASSRSY